MPTITKFTKEPKVVIVTRTKDRNLFLKRALDSVQNQTFTDFIHVVVNDGGDKNIVDEIVERYKHRTKVIHNEKCTGFTKALNQGIKSVKSEYISILDDDDTWAPKFLKSTINHLDETASAGVVTVIDRIVEDIIDGNIKTTGIDRWRPDIKAVNLYGQCVDNYAPTVAFVYRRKIYEELNGYDEKLGVSEDWDFALRFLLKYDIDFLDTKNALSFYHHRPNIRGAEGNSVFATRDVHDQHINMLANKHLREDLQAGKLGLGYIINSLRYQRDTISYLENEREIRNLCEVNNKLNMQLDTRLNEARKQIVSDINKEINDNILNQIISYRIYKKIRK